MQKSIDISLNNYKHFKGTELIYESNGTVKEIEYYYCSEDLIYKDEYLNRKRNGNGKEYNADNIFIYEGDI